VLRFQDTVLSVALFFLIITLLIIGIALYRNRASLAFPPVVADCPDYWTIDGSGNNATCLNVKDLGTCRPSRGRHLSMNFNNAPFTGAGEMCAKYTWANRCNVSWDGITYGTNNPCQRQR
jgi:hypothetical protein